MSKPTIIGKAALYNMDCMELLKATPDKFYELAIVDPPYGINVMARMESAHLNNRSHQKYTSAGNGTGKWLNYEPKPWDKTAPNKEFFTELIRASKRQIVWGAHVLCHLLPVNKKWIVWHKTPQGMNFSKCDLAWTSFPGGVDYFYYLLNESNGFLKHKDGGRIHPTQKPIKLYEWLLSNYAKAGDKILDTHLGSMSSVIACLNMGFEITGCELDADYFAAGIKRVEQSKKQERLFA